MRGIYSLVALADKGTVFLRKYRHFHREKPDSSHRERKVFHFIHGRIIPLKTGTAVNRSIVYIVKGWYAFHSSEVNPRLTGTLLLYGLNLTLQVDKLHTVVNNSNYSIHCARMVLISFMEGKPLIIGNPKFVMFYGLKLNLDVEKVNTVVNK